MVKEVMYVRPGTDRDLQALIDRAAESRRLPFSQDPDFDIQNNIHIFLIGVLSRRVKMSSFHYSLSMLAVD